MFVISVIAFAIQDNLGDPIQQMVGQSVPESEREVLREELGLNDPFLVQYFRFAVNAAQFDFGYSYFFNEPTTDVILRHLPATLELVAAATFLIVTLSVPIGVYSAIKPRSPLSRLFMGVSIVGISIQVFLTAIVLIQIFAIGGAKQNLCLVFALDIEKRSDRGIVSKSQGLFFAALDADSDFELRIAEAESGWVGWVFIHHTREPGIF